MSDADQILSNIIAWANTEPNVRSLVLVGSRARNEPTDNLADIDVQVYTETLEPYTQDEAWLLQFAPVWVCVRDKYRHGDLVVPTRLVIFDGGTKADFALYPSAAVADVDPNEPARRVLLDKDGVAPHSTYEPINPKAPSEAEFKRVVQEFWFEVYHVAKYLARGELWLAKARDWETKRFLLTMIEWYARARQGWDLGTHQGKQMRSWAGSEVWESLHSAFSHFEADDSWRGLRATAELFRRLAKETAAVYGIVYPNEVDRNISGFIADLEQKERTGRSE